MMAFFMVMWILGMDQQLRQAIEGYFSNPVGYKKGYSGGATPISSGASPASVKTNAIFLASREYQRKRFDESRTSCTRSSIASHRLESCGRKSRSSSPRLAFGSS
jgi:chemotaxis protein MotB